MSDPATSSDSEGEAQRLYGIAARGISDGRGDIEKWVNGISDASDDVLVRLLSKLPGHAAARAYTDAVRAILDLRISHRGLNAMERLEGSAKRLAVVGVLP